MLHLSQISLFNQIQGEVQQQGDDTQYHDAGDHQIQLEEVCQMSETAKGQKGSAPVLRYYSFKVIMVTGEIYMGWITVQNS